jgi:hypothetical protein
LDVLRNRDLLCDREDFSELVVGYVVELCAVVFGDDQLDEVRQLWYSGGVKVEHRTIWKVNIQSGLYSAGQCRGKQVSSRSRRSSSRGSPLRHSVSNCLLGEKSKANKMLPLMILQKMQAAEDIVVLVKVNDGWLIDLVSRVLKMTQDELEGRSGVVRRMWGSCWRDGSALLHVEGVCHVRLNLIFVVLGNICLLYANSCWSFGRTPFVS